MVIGLGYLTGKYFHINLEALSKLIFYIFAPAFIFQSLLKFRPSVQNMKMDILFNVLLMTLLFGLSYLLFRKLHFPKKLLTNAALAATLFNSANYGIPVIDLAFSTPGIAIQVITVMTLNILTYTLGIIVAGGLHEWKQGILTVLKHPILYSIFLAFLLNDLHLTLPAPILSAVQWLSYGMLPVALLTLGIQLAKKITFHYPKELWITVVFRLLVSPLIALCLILLLHLHGLLAKVLWVSSAFPTAVVTVLFEIEYGTEASLAAGAVFWTTLLSIFSVTIIISLSSWIIH